MMAFHRTGRIGGIGGLKLKREGFRLDGVRAEKWVIQGAIWDSFFQEFG